MTPPLPRPAAPTTPTTPRRIAFLLVPDFSLIAFAAAIEPLRLADRSAEERLYAWSLHSADGRPVTASNGMTAAVDGRFADVAQIDAAIVCAGIDVETKDVRELTACLRRLAKRGVALGAVCTGTWVLAKAGVLGGRRATIHWENHAALVDAFPDLAVSQELFEIDGDRFTCAGGAAAMDMMLSVIARDHDDTLALGISDQLIHQRIRDAGERQRTGTTARLAAAPPKLVAALAEMEADLGRAVDVGRIALGVGLSTRQLERLFKDHLGVSPARHHLTLRLERGRALMRQTRRPIVDVALDCGFASASHFSKAFAAEFGHPPSVERKPREGSRSTTSSP